MHQFQKQHRHNGPPARLPRQVNSAERIETLKTGVMQKLHLWPDEIDLDTPTGRMLIRQRLKRALRRQRRDARAGCWHYDIADHSRLLQLNRQFMDEFGRTVSLAGDDDFRCRTKLSVAPRAQAHFLGKL